MADRSLKDLNYGHPGVASYDLENRKWAFARGYTKRSVRQILTLQNTPSTRKHATPTSAQPFFPKTPANRTSIQDEISSAVEDDPLLAPAAELIPDLALVSAAISSAASTYDPLVGDLLSFGSITPKGRHEAWRIAALPTGETGSILQLCILDNERHGWATESVSWVQGQTLKAAESVFWNEEAAPIQQVCFAHSEDKRPLLAVRLPTRTVLFHPDYHHQPRAATISPFYRLPASTIQANPVLSIHQNDTGGYPHVDVAFNPGFQLQFALVDQSQTWSVWDIEHRLRLGAYSASCVLRGRINESDDEDTTGQDGWARILWLADVTTLLVCNRRHVSIVSIKGGSASYLPCPEIFSERSADWILDVRRHPKDSRRVFVLTSTRLVLIAVTPPSELLSSADETGAKIILSWQHYRGAEDFTLGMSVQMLTDDETCLMIHSRVNNLVQVYSFIERSSGLITSSDPTLLDLSIPGSGQITNIFIETMEQGDLRSEVGFFQLFVTQSDLSVHELVVYTRASADDSLEDDQAIADFTQSTIRRHRNTFKSHAANKDDDFISPDGLATTELPHSKIATPRLHRDDNSSGSAAHEARNNSLLGEIISRSKSLAEESGAMDAVAVMDQVNEMLATGANLPSLPLGTLMEFTRTHFHVADIDEASSNFQELFSSGYGQDTMDVQRIAPIRVLGLAYDDNPTISDVYDTILQTWIAPLPPEVPIRVRQRWERLARRVATELMFSSTRIRDDRRQVPTSSTQHRQSKRGVALPILPSRPKEGAFHPTSRYPISQPLPTPPYSSMPPSSVLGSSPPEAPSTPPTLPNSLTHLSKYLPTSKDLAIIHPNVAQGLAHWQLGSDPHTYNWASLERALQSEDLDEESQQQREKERKKRERREKRQQRENELMKAKFELMRSKAVGQPTAFLRSSPGPMLGSMGSSSQVPSQSQIQVPSHGSSFTMPQSQVERGKFGGKLDKKKKKKGRISGF